MMYLVCGLLVLLVVLHQDFWFRDDGRLAFGFLPVGLLYHVGISLAAAAVWVLAVKFAWPVDDDPAADQKPGFSEKPGFFADRNDPSAAGDER